MPARPRREPLIPEPAGGTPRPKRPDEQPLELPPVQPPDDPNPRSKDKADREGNGYAYGEQPWYELDDARALAERTERLHAGYHFPEPEDQARAHLSPQGGVEYVEDLLRPGRIVVVAAEEGAGKSFAITGELAIRMALAGGSFAGTWPVLEAGPVLVLSEMHPDDDYDRQERVLAALGRRREELLGGLYRLPLMTAAGGVPALTDENWRAYITGWIQLTHTKLVVFDTATGATLVDPWGKEIQEVFRALRVMLSAAPDLAIILIVHLKKPSGRGDRRISDVLGEWGRWNDVTLLMEADGEHRVKLTSRKRVRHQRRILATKRDGLLVEPEDISEGAKPKVPMVDVVAAIAAEPGIGVKELGARLGVSKNTAQRYAGAAEAAGEARHDEKGPRGAHRYFAGPEGESELLAQLGKQP